MNKVVHYKVICYGEQLAHGWVKIFVIFFTCSPPPPPPPQLANFFWEKYIGTPLLAILPSMAPIKDYW
jgi:hypothetical protein